MEKPTDTATGETIFSKTNIAEYFIYINILILHTMT